MLQLPRTFLFSLLLVLILASFFSPIPVAVQSVNGPVISSDWKNYLESYLLEVDTNTSAEIVIYVLDSLYGHGIKKDGVEINEKVQLGVYIFNELELNTPSGSVVGIGKKEKDNGVLILVVMLEREWRIEIGYGLEGYITDVESKRIAEEYLVPKFQEENYGEGFADTVYALAQNIPIVNENERTSTRERYVYDNSESSTDEEIPWWVIVLFVIFMLFMIRFGGRFSGRRRGRGWGGGFGGGGSSGGGGGGGSSGGGGSGGGW